MLFPAGGMTTNQCGKEGGGGGGVPITPIFLIYQTSLKNKIKY